MVKTTMFSELWKTEILVSWSTEKLYYNILMMKDNFYSLFGSKRDFFLKENFGIIFR